MSTSVKSELNKMLKEEHLSFSERNKNRSEQGEGIFKVKISASDKNKVIKVIESAVKNPKQIANIEYECNNNQPVECTIKHLNLLSLYLNDICKLTDREVANVDARSKVSIADVLVDFQIWATKSKSDLQLIVDAPRKAALLKIFGSDCIQPLLFTHYLGEPNTTSDIFHTTLAVFESGDTESAIDTLLMNLSDQTIAPWRIKSVYVQESIKETFLKALTPERLSRTTHSGTSTAIDANNKYHTVAQKFNAQLISSSDAHINILIGVPRNHLDDLVPVCWPDCQATVVNFFRTPKELYQLCNGDTKSAESMRFLSIWSENILLFYEAVNSINANLFWSNSIGMFYQNFPRIFHGLIELNARDERFVTYLHCSKLIVNNRFFAILIAAHSHKCPEKLHCIALEREKIGNMLLFRLVSHFRINSFFFLVVNIC